MEELDKINKGLDNVKSILSKELSVQSNAKSIEMLKKQLAESEKLSIYISVWKRSISKTHDEYRSEVILDMRSDDTYGKMNADEKKSIVDGKLAEIKSMEVMLKDMQDIVSRRCSLGQTLLKSIGEENKNNGMSKTPFVDVGF